MFDAIFRILMERKDIPSPPSPTNTHTLKRGEEKKACYSLGREGNWKSRQKSGER